MIYPLVRDMHEEERIPIKRICAKMGLCVRAYYDWRKSPFSNREVENKAILNYLRTAHENDPAAGYRVLRDDIEPELHKKGLYAGRKRVWRICSRNGIFANHSNIHAKGAKGGRSGPPAHEDKVGRVFSGYGPNQVWLSDITEHYTREGKVYWCGFKDLCSNRIVGQAAGARMTAGLVESALLDALENRGYPKDVIVHSDRGSQYRSGLILEAIRAYGLLGSMGQVRTCADNAPMESFNALLQKNVLNQRKVWDSRSELIHSIYRWVNVRYNKQRRQAALGRMTPEEYELVYFDLFDSESV